MTSLSSAEVLAASGGTGSAFAVLAQRLRAGRLVALVCDRDVTGSGIEVEFFGEQARMMGGAAALAVQTGAALMPVILWFEGYGWGVHVHQEIPVPAEGDSKQQAAAMTQELARLFEAGIRAHPQDWHMLHASSPPTSTPGGCGVRLAASQRRGPARTAARPAGI
jgi:phosphatidylinositol dimannoside acyltransferase